MRLTDEERLLRHCERVGDCLIWTGSTNQQGYGVLSVGKRRVRAHQLAYLTWVGPIPEGLELDHLCRTRRCIDPRHLEPVTHWTNLMRGQSPSALNARKTHCPQGHPYDELNTYLTKQNVRQCRACHRARQLKRHHAIAAARAALSQREGEL